MVIVPEHAIESLLTRADTFDAVAAVFSAMAQGSARNFPVVREALDQAGALYGFKSGFDRERAILGVKAGGYWSHNSDNGLANHQSTVVLFDPETGQCRAVVGGNRLTAVRTAAAAAVSIRHLAPRDARVLGIIGAGHQAPFQLRAALEQRPFERVIGWNRHPEHLDRLASIAAEHRLPFEAVDCDRIGREADVIVTITSSFEPLLLDEQVSGETHIVAMGTDTEGKQELEPALVARATCFTDEVAQSVRLGECQHAVRAGLLTAGMINEIGTVINGETSGRTSEREITVFDGTGVGLQDLAVATTVFERAVEAGVAVHID